MKWLPLQVVLLFSLVVDALKIEHVTFPDHAMLGQTITMVCDYHIGESEYIDSIKWYKDNKEFYRIVPHTSIEKDKVVIFHRPGIHLEKEKSGVSLELLLLFERSGGGNCEAISDGA
jgi:hypothetical protein